MSLETQKAVRGGACWRPRVAKCGCNVECWPPTSVMSNEVKTPLGVDSVVCLVCVCVCNLALSHMYKNKVIELHFSG